MTWWRAWRSVRALALLPLFGLASPTPGLDVGQLLERWGFPMAVVAMFVVGWIVPGPTHKTTIAEKREAEALVRTLTTAFAEQVIPALTRANDALTRATEVLDRTTDTLGRVEGVLSRAGPGSGRRSG